MCLPAAGVAPTWEAEAVRAEQYVKKTKHRRYQLRTAQQPQEDKAWQDQESGRKHTILCPVCVHALTLRWWSDACFV